MNSYQSIIDTILEHYPDVQAIYLFGSYGTENERPDSDIDVAILLPVESAKRVNHREWIKLITAIAMAEKRENIDLINLREVNTVFRKEIVMTGRRIYCADENAADEFEMLTISQYQQLQDERKDIIREAIKSGRILHA